MSPFEWRTVTFAMLPRQLASFEALADQLVDVQDLVGVAPVELHDDFARYLGQYARFKNVRNVGTTVAVLTRIARDQIELGKEPGDEERWVKIESALMGDSMPASAAKVLTVGVAHALRHGKGTKPWHVLEAWAAEEVAG